MPNQESAPETPNKEYRKNLRIWQSMSKGDDRLLSIRSIMTVCSQVVRKGMSDEDIDAVTWLLTMGELLSDIALHEPNTTH